MKTYIVKLKQKGGGGLEIQTQITSSSTMSSIRQIAENQNPGYFSISVKQV
tara:strand:+ start:218 stop:370 length:153 start_codon:yes stop_codon:yes gene_type:complete